MKFGNFKSTEALNRNFNRIRELGLESHVSELNTYGFTVVPPEKVADREFFLDIRETVLRICKERTGFEFQLDKNGEFGEYKAQPQSDGQFLLFYLLMADPIFEKWILNPTLYTLIDYLMGGQQQLSSLTSFVKWKGERQGLGLHSDSPPDRDGHLPACSDVANAAYCLTDYTLDNGAIAMVPGSHRYCRQPRPGEGEKNAVPVEAEAGSLIAWHGNTWHGAFPKKTDGLRLNVTSYHCHRRLKTQEAYQWRVTQEMLDRNPTEFARLVAADDHMGWDERGPDYARSHKYLPEEAKKQLREFRRKQAEAQAQEAESAAAG
ncbi:MAG: phytanoyl-CoA dioxygenase family protein [Gammaproteobacteria bacterium]|nr:phytanoyl-CoA dioxygenase family protein [Gammaproteobacteria bacterium]